MNKLRQIFTYWGDVNFVHCVLMMWWFYKLSFAGCESGEITAILIQTSKKLFIHLFQIVKELKKFLQIKWNDWLLTCFRNFEERFMVHGSVLTKRMQVIVWFKLEWIFYFSSCISSQNWAFAGTKRFRKKRNRTWENLGLSNEQFS